MYDYKELNYGFIILCSEHKINLLTTSVNSIKRNYNDVPLVCISDNTANNNDLLEMKKLCPTYLGKDTFSSLINVGIRHAPADWNFIICAGTSVRGRLNDKFSLFIENDKDILFPIANKRFNFIDGTINGLLINKKTFKCVGDMGEDSNFEHVKISWAIKAIEKGCIFKAIANSKLC